MAAPINVIIGFQENAELYDYQTEPVSLQELKDYAKIDFDTDDTLLQSLITVSRLFLETYTGLSFIPKRLTAQLRNECGGIEIPYGPMQGDLDQTLITDRDGNETTIETEGLDFLSIRTQTAFVQLIYGAGYTTLPEPLKTAIKAQAFFLYENRGERLSFGMAGDNGVRNYSVEYIADLPKQLCKRYRRVWDAMF